MIRRSARVLAAVVLTILLGTAYAEENAEALLEGKTIALDRNAGNCAACHMMDDAELPGNSGPPLLQMQLRFPDRDRLRRQIWDAMVANPDTVMPPYGRHMILTEEELELVVDYIHSL